MHKLKLAVIGAGSTYSPEIMEGLIQRRDILPFTHITLMDIDQTKLHIVGGLMERMARACFEEMLEAHRPYLPQFFK